MTPDELRKEINSLLMDIEFEYKGEQGAICPFSRDNISVSYGDQERTFRSVDEVMDEPFIEGKPIKEICEEFNV